MASLSEESWHELCTFVKRVDMLIILSALSKRQLGDDNDPLLLTLYMKFLHSCVRNSSMAFSLIRLVGRMKAYFFDPIPPPPWYHPPPRHHIIYANAIGAVMFFWFFYRAKEDGPVLLGLKHPWEQLDDEEGDDGHGGASSHHH